MEIQRVLMMIIQVVNKEIVLQWTSYIDGVTMTAGNTYYIVIDGYGYSEGNYQIRI